MYAQINKDEDGSGQDMNQPQNISNYNIAYRPTNFQQTTTGTVSTHCERGGVSLGGNEREKRQS